MGASVREFLRRVVPWPASGGPGFINAHYKGPRFQGMGGRPFNDLDQFIAYAIVWGNANPAWVTDMYFCLSQQAKTGGVGDRGRVKAARHADDATFLKAVWADIDGYKDYPSKDAALAAITAFLKAAALPTPTALVDSGGGWHVYWISDKPLTPAEWRAYAYGLWEKVQQHGLKADPLTTDAARILRVPATFNHKQQPARPVTLKWLQPADLDFAKTMPRAVQAPVATPAKPTKVLLFDPALFPPRGALQDTLAPDCLRADMEIDPFTIIAECPHFAEAAKTGGRNHGQGLWMQTILATTWFKKGRKLAHAFSHKYPSYDPQETDDMYDRKMADREDKGLGWPSCATFEREGCKLCATCVHKGKVRSPLNLGKKAVAPQIAFTVAVTSPSPPGLCLPKGFCVEPTTGYIGWMKTRGSALGASSTKFAPLFRCKLSNPWVEKDPRVLHFTATVDKGHDVGVQVKFKELGGLQTLTTSLFDQGVLIDPDNKDRLVTFMTYWIEELHAAKEALVAVPFGWWFRDGAPHGFAYAGKIFKDDGTVVPSGSGDAKLRQKYMPKGELQPWIDALKLITDQHRPSVELIAAASFASPLIYHTGKYSGCLTGYSQTGGQKTSATVLGLAVWGHPVSTKEVASTSTNSLLGRMGDIRNLPMYWDDVSTPERVAKAAIVISDATEGKAGGKMDPNRQQRETGEWHSLLTVTANRNMWDHMAHVVKTDTAQLMRLFCFEVIKSNDNTPGVVPEYVATPMLQALESNYGQMGLAYSMYLGTHPLQVRQAVLARVKAFGAKVNAVSEERFWVAICAAVLEGVKIANWLGASFNEAELEVFLIDTFLGLRQKAAGEFLEGGGYENTTEILSAFINSHTSELIRVSDLPLPKKGRIKKVVADSGPDIDRPYRISMCMDKTRATLKISKRRFVDYITELKIGRTMVFDGLHKHYQMQADFPQQAIAFGTYYTSAPEAVMIIPVPKASWLWEMMYARTAPDDVPTPPDQPAADPGISHTV